tara:strand:+ start:1811 stop:2110 length:300 start_codon:yes stop_codon:yes gene_type:complete
MPIPFPSLSEATAYTCEQFARSCGRVEDFTIESTETEPGSHSVYWSYNDGYTEYHGVWAFYTYKGEYDPEWDECRGGCIHFTVDMKTGDRFSSSGVPIN